MLTYWGLLIFIIYVDSIILIHIKTHSITIVLHLFANRYHIDKSKYCAKEINKLCEQKYVN